MRQEHRADTGGLLQGGDNGAVIAQILVIFFVFECETCSRRKKDRVPRLVHQGDASCNPSLFEVYLLKFCTKGGVVFYYLASSGPLQVGGAACGSQPTGVGGITSPCSQAGPEAAGVFIRQHMIPCCLFLFEVASVPSGFGGFADDFPEFLNSKQ